jgi:hypothetical protein
MLSATYFKHVLWLLVAVTLALQWVALHISRLHLEPQWEAVSSGLGIFGAAFLLMGGGAGTKRPAASSRDCASSFDCGAARDFIGATGPTRHEHGRFAFLKGQQWTLLIGMLPVVYAVSARGLGAMEMDQRQVEEMFLTGAQSLFAVAILANLSFSLMAAIVIFALFATQLLVPDPAFRYYYSIFYVG